MKSKSTLNCISFIILFALRVSAQSPPTQPAPPASIIFKVVETMPRFPGCEDIVGTGQQKYECSQTKMLEYVYRNLKYPPLAREHGVQGEVVAQFVVGKDGSIEDVKIVRDIGSDCGTAVVSILENMNNMPEKWLPGTQKGRPVKVLFTLPIQFSLEGGDDGGYSTGKIKSNFNNFKFGGSYPKDDILCIEDHCTTPEIKESLIHYYSFEVINGKVYFRVSRNNSASYSTEPILSNSRYTRPIKDLNITLINKHVISSSVEHQLIFIRKFLGGVEFTDYYFYINDSDVDLIKLYPIEKAEFGYYKKPNKLKSANSWSPSKKDGVKIARWVKELSGILK